MALAQFLRSMVSHRSRYDQGLASNFSNFTAEEQLGKDLFFSWDRTHCQNCHGGVNFSGWGGDAANIGLEMEYVDKGLKEITGVASDEGRFKVPSLRNVALTAPYMHDGRFATLEEVVNHYDHGALANPYLDYRMGGNAIIFDGGFNGGGVIDPIPGGGNGTVEPRRLDLTDVEKRALVAFLKTLTDEALVNDPRYSDPFR
jgi:cytochrome c peroxidase